MAQPYRSTEGLVRFPGVAFGRVRALLGADGRFVVDQFGDGDTLLAIGLSEGGYVLCQLRTPGSESIKAIAIQLQKATVVEVAQAAGHRLGAALSDSEDFLGRPGSLGSTAQQAENFQFLDRADGLGNQIPQSGCDGNFAVRHVGFSLTVGVVENAGPGHWLREKKVVIVGHGLVSGLINDEPARGVSRLRLQKPEIGPCSGPETGIPA